jgi:hypothetical protein
MVITKQLKFMVTQHKISTFAAVVRQGKCQIRQNGCLFWQFGEVNEQHVDLSIYEVIEL